MLSSLLVQHGVKFNPDGACALDGGHLRSKLKLEMGGESCLGETTPLSRALGLLHERANSI